MAKIANIVKKFMFKIFFFVLLEELLVEVVGGCDEKIQIVSFLYVPRIRNSCI